MSHRNMLSTVNQCSTTLVTICGVEEEESGQIESLSGASTCKRVSVSVRAEITAVFKSLWVTTGRQVGAGTGKYQLHHTGLATGNSGAGRRGSSAAGTRSADDGAHSGGGMAEVRSDSERPEATPGAHTPRGAPIQVLMRG
ncbi:hypothetical protein B0H13DRAFT_1875507 [Mycena leptocephala]|nr:hypothetical protein B0H13DRAFT_1875507 [Mycena leptocephala]